MRTKINTSNLKMFIQLLASYAPLVQIEDCFDSSLVNIQLRQKSIILKLQSLGNTKCQTFQNHVQFQLEMKTKTKPLDIIFIRTKQFKYGKSNEFMFTSLEALDEISGASVIMKSMTYYTVISIGQIVLDTDIPSDCFTTSYLDLSGNLTTLKLQPSDFCDYLASSTVVSVIIPSLNLEKKPSVGNESVFLLGFSDLTSELRVQFGTDLEYSILKAKVQEELEFQLQIAIGDITYLISSSLTKVIGSDFGPLGTSLKVIDMYSQFSVVFLQVDVVFEELKSIKVSEVEVQMSTNTSSLYWFNSYSAIDQISRNITFMNTNQSIPRQLGETFFLDMIGVLDGKVQYFIQVEIQSYQASSFSDITVNFVEGKVRLDITQVPRSQTTSLRTQDLSQMYFTSESSTGEVIELFVDEFKINLDTDYVSFSCQDECLQIKQMYMSKKIIKTTLDFKRKQDDTPFNIFQIFYVSVNQNDVKFPILIMGISILIAIIWCIVQLYLEKKVRKVRQKKIKKIHFEEI